MNRESRISSFVQLGLYLEGFLKGTIKDSELEEAIGMAHASNGWFTPDNVESTLRAISASLFEDKIRKWLEPYQDKDSCVRVGVIMAGNIPAAGFHDWISTLISGNVFIGKTASDDKYLLPALSVILIKIEPDFADKILFTPNRIVGADAFIATGSNNSSRYFEYYFRNLPYIIRKNRNSAAVLSGSESESDMKLLGKDVFQYFGLGCRNVSKLFVPEGYDFDNFFKSVFGYSELIQHKKYANNYDYHKTIYLLDKKELLENGFLLLKEDTGFASPVATVFYEYYKDENTLADRLNQVKDQLQCVVSKMKIPGIKTVGFGQSQNPELWDYADGVDTIKFLNEVKSSELQE